jgi:hypothetical protein
MVHGRYALAQPIHNSGQVALSHIPPTGPEGAISAINAGVYSGMQLLLLTICATLK